MTRVDRLLKALLKIAEEPGSKHEKAAIAWAAIKKYEAEAGRLQWQ